MLKLVILQDYFKQSSQLSQKQRKSIFGNYLSNNLKMYKLKKYLLTLTWVNQVLSQLELEMLPLPLNREELSPLLAKSQ